MEHYAPSATDNAPAHQNPPERVQLYLIKPSCYDDDGFVVRHFRGVLPSNTLACLTALTRDALELPALRHVDMKVRLIDESVMKVDTEKIIATARKGIRTIVGLVGVQTHQYPRSADIARRLARGGVSVIIGGFHVSGQLAVLPTIPEEIQEMIDAGVTIVKGEVEDRWAEVLTDAVYGRLQPLYDFIHEKPALDSAPIPTLDRKVLSRFVSSNHGTIDCSRGCPFTCTFCTIIAVQGRKMRVRSAEGIVRAIRENFRQNGVTFYFFTDDNFARNQNWKSIFEALTALREEEGIPFEFMMQVDVLSYRIEGFIDAARRAGCTNVFIGMESVNVDNLKAAGKRQNHVDEYRKLIQSYRRREIATHVGYIIGFPFDSPESIQRDLDCLMNQVEVDMASFFIMTPLPGSADYVRFLQEGKELDADFNRYDSQHYTMDFPEFDDAQSLLSTYWGAWESFYSFENMARVLTRAPRRNYWNLFRNFLWYKYSSSIEKRHPMMTGFLRLKGRTAVREGVEPLPRLKYYRRRASELKGQLFSVITLLLEMQMLWLETRKKGPTEERVLEELRQLRSETIRVRLSDIQAAYVRAREALPHLRVPSRFQLFIKKWSPFSASGAFYSPQDVLEFWNRSLAELQRGRLNRVSFPRLVTRLWQDLSLSLHFAAAWMRRSGAN